MSALLIANSFWTSTERLTAAEGGRVLEFIRKLQQDPSQPGISLERVAKSPDTHAWAARISQDLRAILSQDGDTFTLLYAGHHDDAYRWAERHRAERNAVTGALQIVESPVIVADERLLPAVPAATPRLLAGYSDAYLLSLGLPPDWLPVAREVTSDDGFLELSAHLPEEAAENLFRLLAGEAVDPAMRTPISLPAIQNPDTQRRFFLLERDDELQRMLEAPLSTWIAFLHPSQRRLVTGHFDGPVKVTGSAGTGKTVVALHRARYLARLGQRVLLTSYVSTLCDNLRHTLAMICTPQELAHIKVATVHSQAGALVSAAGEQWQALTDQELPAMIAQARWRAECRFETPFLLAEWNAVLRAQDISTWEEYRAADRAGRGLRLSATERSSVWQVFELILRELEAQRRTDWAGLCKRARELLAAGCLANPFTAVVVDEVQDLGPQELRLLAALGGRGPDGLMIAGDGGQRIYQRRFSLRSAGIAVRGRSFVLRINYRTTEQIRRFADRLLDELTDDLDDGEEERHRCQSLFRGPSPAACGFASTADEYCAIAETVAGWIEAGLSPNEIAVFAPSNRCADAIKARLDAKGLVTRRLSSTEPPGRPAVSVGTMHRAKGLEFKAVIVADASDDLLPAPAVLTAVDPADRADALERERRLLYVALTRARDEVMITWAGRPCRFLGSLLASADSTIAAG